MATYGWDRERFRASDLREISGLMWAYADRMSPSDDKERSTKPKKLSAEHMGSY